MGTVGDTRADRGGPQGRASSILIGILACVTGTAELVLALASPVLSEPVTLHVAVGCSLLILGIWVHMAAAGAGTVRSLQAVEILTVLLLVVAVVVMVGDAAADGDRTKVRILPYALPVGVLRIEPEQALVDREGATFVLTNGWTESVFFTGYLGAPSPFYDVELGRDDFWRPLNLGWCGTGAGACELAAGESVRFRVRWQHDPRATHVRVTVVVWAKRGPWLRSEVREIRSDPVVIP